jgi:pimeloyl-ACP methyl ester carboxylesterase
MTRAEAARVDEVEQLRREGRATAEDALERFNLIWPHYFADPAQAPPSPVDQVGVQCSADTNASLMDHFGRRTLQRALPRVTLPVLFVHGQSDPLPPRSSTATASLIPGAEVVILEGRGHFPWLEEPGIVRETVRERLR